VNWREAARSGEWAQHFSDASCFIKLLFSFFFKFHAIIYLKMNTKQSLCRFLAWFLRRDVEVTAFWLCEAERLSRGVNEIYQSVSSAI